MRRKHNCLTNCLNQKFVSMYLGEGKRRVELGPSLVLYYLELKFVLMSTFVLFMTLLIVEKGINSQALALKFNNLVNQKLPTSK